MRCLGSRCHRLLHLLLVYQCISLQIACQTEKIDKSGNFQCWIVCLIKIFRVTVNNIIFNGNYCRQDGTDAIIYKIILFIGSIVFKMYASLTCFKLEAKKTFKSVFGELLPPSSHAFERKLNINRNVFISIQNELPDTKNANPSV